MSNFADWSEVGLLPCVQWAARSPAEGKTFPWLLGVWSKIQDTAEGSLSPGASPGQSGRAKPQHSDSPSHGSPSLVLLSKLRSVLISLSLAKCMKYSGMYQVSYLTCSFMFWCYKTSIVPHQQKTMHWQLWIEMFQHFIPREIHEDCLFTSTQNNISVLKVKISHKVEF